MKKYIIKSITANCYYAGIEPLNVETKGQLHYNVYWCRDKKDASFFTNYKSASDCIVLIHGMMDGDEEMIVEEVEE